MKIDVNRFILDNYTEYTGDEKFLSPMTKRNKKLWEKYKKFLKKEQKRNGVYDIETKIFSGINTFKPGYIDKKNELIVGFQTDTPLKRIVNPYGGIRMVEKCLQAYGYKISKKILNNFKQIRKTHNDGVFDAYTTDIKKARHVGLITGLPDAYGRGRIIGDYRRVALYGTDILISEKKKDLATIEDIQLREEVSMQIKALKEMTKMAEGYGCDISKPAVTAQEAL